MCDFSSGACDYSCGLYSRPIGRRGKLAQLLRSHHEPLHYDFALFIPGHPLPENGSALTAETKKKVPA